MSATDPRELVPLAVEIFVSDVDASIRFYSDVLGFETIRVDQVGGRTDFAVLDRGGAILMLCSDAYLREPAGAPRGSGVEIRIMVPDADLVRQQAIDGGARIVRDIADRDYGLRDFIVQDPDRFLIRFASPLPGRRI